MSPKTTTANDGFHHSKVCDKIAEKKSKLSACEFDHTLTLHILSSFLLHQPKSFFHQKLEMGQGQSVQLTRDTIVADQYLAYCDAKQRMVNKMYQKCVGDSAVNSEESRHLSAQERACVEEYSLQYTMFVKSGFSQFAGLYESHQRDMYEKARMQAMAQQARSDIGKAKGA